MRDIDLLVRSVLRGIRPRPGFRAELATMLTDGSPYVAEAELPRTGARTRWIIAGAAVAGVASATGAVYLGHRRHRRSACS